MSAAQQIFEKAFRSPRDPRSEAYKRGVRDALTRMEAGDLSSKMGSYLPYEIGTAEADAWFAGIEEGKMRWRHHMDEKTGTHNEV